MKKTMQVLESRHWIDVHTRCKTDEGMKRIYRQMLNANKTAEKQCNPIICGMRIITVHFQALGVVPKCLKNNLAPQMGSQNPNLN
ncbi:MAG: hypothetical protein KGL39_41790 [Patescibacteria group bacterium]|nr:hypothetical protein [Patescibacteria group bacterium]